MQNIIVNDRQHLLDIAIQSAGSAEAAKDLALQNGISITDMLEVGEGLAAIQPINREIVQLMGTENIKPATDGVLLDEGIGYFRIGVDFTIK